MKSTFIAFCHVLLTFKFIHFFSGPPVEFLYPPEQVEVRVGEQARLHCEFRCSSVPVACCWIYNRDKVVMSESQQLLVLFDPLLWNCFPVKSYVLVHTSTFLPTQVVVGGPRMSVRSSDTQSSVEISQACADDTGSYTVIVRNQKGSAQHTVSLSIIGETLDMHKWMTYQYSFNKQKTDRKEMWQSKI